jgi:hypothetical protein
MGLRAEFVEYLAEKVAEELVEGEFIEVPDDLPLKEILFEKLNNEVTVEERLNEEVRQILNEYGNQMRESGASYQETFKLIKRKLVRERKLVI